MFVFLNAFQKLFFSFDKRFSRRPSGGFSNAHATFLTYFLVFAASDAARILGVFTVPSLSHQVVYRALTKELHRRGHQLTVVTTDPIGDPGLKNYTEVDIGYLYRHWRSAFDFSSDAHRITRIFPELLFVSFGSLSQKFCEMYLTDPNIQRLRKEEFDLMITEFGPTMCLYPLSLRANNNTIGIFSTSILSALNRRLGSPLNPAYVPDFGFPYTDHMTFFQRMRTCMFYVFAWCHSEYMSWRHNQIASRHFGPGTPHIREIEKNISIVFLNSHFTTGYPIPTSAKVVTIGGPPFHLDGWAPEELPSVRFFGRRSK